MYKKKISLRLSGAALGVALGALIAAMPASAQENRFIYAAIAVPGNLDMWTKYEGDSSWNLAYEVGSVLVEYAPEDGCNTLAGVNNLRPVLATSWQYSEDEKQLRFKLREGVKSPAGNEMTSEDVVWSLNFAKSQSASARFLFSNAADFAKENTFEAIDKYTVAVNLNRRTAMDVAIFTLPLVGVMDTKTVLVNSTDADPMALEWLAKNLANFGPWAQESFTPNSEISFRRNENYWDKESVGNLEAMTIRAIPEAGTRTQLLLAGQVDYAERLSFDEYLSLEGSGTAKLENCVSPNRERLVLNQEYEPLADARVRRALSLAVNREALKAGVYKGLFEASKTGLTQSYIAGVEGATPLAYDPEQAKALLKEAGAEGLSIELTATPAKPGPWSQSIAVQVGEMLKQVGINSTIRVIAGQAEADTVYREGKYQSYINVEIPAVADPYYSLSLYNGSWSFQNTFNFKNDDYDQVTKEVQISTSRDERQRLMVEASNIIAEQVPAIYLSEQRYLRALSTRVSGYENPPHGQLLVYRMSKSN